MKDEKREAGCELQVTGYKLNFACAVFTCLHVYVFTCLLVCLSTCFRVYLSTSKLSSYHGNEFDYEYTTSLSFHEWRSCQGTDDVL